MSQSNQAEREAARAARKVTTRAIRRLDALGWIMMLGAVAIALAGGAGVAWLVGEPSGFGFRPTWMVASLFLLIVPGAIALIRMRMDPEGRPTEPRNHEEGIDG